VAERQVLRDAIRIRGIDRGCATETAAVFGSFALGQVAATRAGAQNLSARLNLKTLGHGLSGLDAFGTSHKIFIAKEREI
jgi:hypothetical protein